MQSHTEAEGFNRQGSVMKWVFFNNSYPCISLAFPYNMWHSIKQVPSGESQTQCPGRSQCNDLRDDDGYDVRAVFRSRAETH